MFLWTVINSCFIVCLTSFQSDKGTSSSSKCIISADELSDRGVEVLFDIRENPHYCLSHCMNGFLFPEN